MGSGMRRWAQRRGLHGIVGLAARSEIVLEAESGHLWRCETAALFGEAAASPGLGSIVRLSLWGGCLHCNAAVVGRTYPGPPQSCLGAVSVASPEDVAVEDVDSSREPPRNDTKHNQTLTASVIGDALTRVWHTSPFRPYVHVFGVPQLPRSMGPGLWNKGVQEARAASDKELEASVIFEAVAQAELDRIHVSHLLRIVGVWVASTAASLTTLCHVYVVPAAPDQWSANSVAVKEAKQMFAQCLMDRCQPAAVVWVSWPPSPVYDVKRCHSILANDPVAFADAVGSENARTKAIANVLEHAPVSLSTRSPRAALAGDWRDALDSLRSSNVINAGDILVTALYLCAAKHRDLWQSPMTPLQWAAALALAFGERIEQRSIVDAVRALSVRQWAVVASVEESLNALHEKIAAAAPPPHDSAVEQSESSLILSSSTSVPMLRNVPLRAVVEASINTSLSTQVEDPAGPLEQLPAAVTQSTVPDASPVPMQVHRHLVRRCLAYYAVHHLASLCGRHELAELCGAVLTRLVVGYTYRLAGADAAHAEDAAKALMALVPFAGKEPLDIRAVCATVEGESFDSCLRAFDLNARAYAARMAIAVASSLHGGAATTLSAADAFELGFGMAVPPAEWPPIIERIAIDDGWVSALRLARKAVRRRFVAMTPALVAVLAKNVPPGHMLRAPAAVQWAECPKAPNHAPSAEASDVIGTAEKVKPGDVDHISTDAVFFVPGVFIAGILACSSAAGSRRSPH